MTAPNPNTSSEEKLAANIHNEIENSYVLCDDGIKRLSTTDATKKVMQLIKAYGIDQRIAEAEKALFLIGVYSKDEAILWQKKRVEQLKSQKGGK